jgi:NADPH-dependent glutamate synthase beta subunit-like oxidoreductase
MPPRFSKPLTEKVIFPAHLNTQPRTSPCETHCPAGNPIQAVHTLLKEHRIEEALAYLHCRNPLPGITGRVCGHPCEEKCNRSQYDEGLAIRSLERFAADHADPSQVIKPRRKEPSGKRLAIIGSGPAGMTCAYFSSLLGHEVTVFESAPVLGGIPRLAIPDARIPKDVVDREVGRVLEAGVRALTNTAVGKDLSFDRIRRDFDACLIAVGTWKERRLDIPGAECTLPAVFFLRQVALGTRNLMGERVIIMGGGGVAFDCALTAMRLGAKEVHVVCVEGEARMCASVEDIAQAHSEGVTIHHSHMIAEILHDQGTAAGIACFPISSFSFDERGDLSVVPASGRQATIAGDTVISAVGMMPNLGFLEAAGLAYTPKGLLKVDPDTLATSLDGVFAAGDIVSGPATVAQAIGSGRRAAIGIHSYLHGLPRLQRVRIDGIGQVAAEDASAPPEPHVVAFEEIMNIDYHEKHPRTQPDMRACRPFEEMDRGLTEEGALCEAARCFHCGHCTSCGCCVEDCAGLILSKSAAGPQVAYFDECWHCGCCRIACPSGAVFYEFPLNLLV